MPKNKNLDEYIDRLISEFGASEDIREQRAGIAERLGLEQNEIAVRKDVLVTKMAQEGLLAEVHVGRMRFIRQLNEDDLGLNPDNPDHKEFLSRYISLGNKYLIDNAYLITLNTLERRGRRVVEKYGFQTRWGYFVPEKNISEMKTELEKIKAEYLTMRDMILAKYDALKEETRAAYKNAARESYRLINLDRYAVAPEEYVEHFVKNIMSMFPTKEEIKDSFYFILSLSFVPLTSTLLEIGAREKLIREKEKAALGAINAEKQTSLMAENYKQEAIKETYREVVETHRRDVDRFLGEVVGRIYSLVYESCSAAKQSMERNGSLSAGDILRLKSLIERVETLNFTNDEEVDNYLNQLKNITETNADRRNVDDVKTVLNDITAEANQTLLMLGCKPRQARSRTAGGDVLVEDPGPDAGPRRRRRMKPAEEVGQLELPAAPTRARRAG
ncbi:MAG: DUF3150 domain-containing protein [Dehalococcoidia bacterium]|nr:MAG: DUF3150 domain-containing protein [Dehalococcoidia bacterium]